ncbi:MAG: T9SS type A sorting domain-containing protein, partial [Chitinophagales bacterium]
PNEYIVISKLPNFIQEFFGVSSMPFDGGLRNSGENVEIKNTMGDVIDIVDYDDAEPWPLEADGSGYSLNLCDEMADNSDVVNWSIGTDGDLSGVYQGVDIYASPGRRGCLIADNIETLDGTLIDLFPNPTNEYLFVQIEGNKDWELSIFNLVGQELLKYETIGSRQQLNVSHLEAGIYFVHFQSKTTNEYYVERIVIK